MHPDMDRETFMARFGAVFEHSPWIAAAVYERSGGKCRAEPAWLREAFRGVVVEAGREKQLALLRAHPELGVAEADRGTLTENSRQEQAGAGLDQCTPREFAAFRSLNARYRDKFGFPFVIAVRGRRKAEILRVFEQRLQNPPDEEFNEALAEVIRIGEQRIGAALDG